MESDIRWNRPYTASYGQNYYISTWNHKYDAQTHTNGGVLSLVDCCPCVRGCMRCAGWSKSIEHSSSIIIIFVLYLQCVRPFHAPNHCLLWESSTFYCGVVSSLCWQACALDDHHTNQALNIANTISNTHVCSAGCISRPSTGSHTHNRQILQPNARSYISFSRSKIERKHSWNIRLCRLWVRVCINCTLKSHRKQANKHTYTL